MLALQRRNPSQIEVIALELVSGLLLIFGIAPFLFLFQRITTDPVILAAREASNTGSMVLAFLDSVGIILPLLMIGFGIFAIRLGLRLRKRDVVAAAWAQQVFMWLVLGGAALLLQIIVQALTQGRPVGEWLASFLVIAVIVAVLVACLWWLRNNADTFQGTDELFARDTRTAWNLLIPTLFVLVIVAARPLEQTFIASLTDRRFASNQEVTFIGLENYARLLGVRFDIIPCTTGENGACLMEDGQIVYPRPRDYLDESYRDLRFRDVSTFDILGNHVVFSARDRDFVDSIGNTLYFSVVSVVLELVLGLFIAMVVHSKFVGRGLLRTAMLVPWAIPTVVSARLWEMMLRDNTSGVINSLYVGLGGASQAWLANPGLQIPALIAVDVWKTTPFMALILLAGLQTIPSDIYEAADVDGASKVGQFFRITLPLLRPTIAVALVFRTLDAVRVFDVFQVLLGRQKLSMATYNFEMLVNNQDFGYASAIGVLIFLLILIFTIVYVRILGVSAE
jgi:trehalose/maltose transport system permease protein